MRTVIPPRWGGVSTPKNQENHPSSLEKTAFAKRNFTSRVPLLSSLHVRWPKLVEEHDLFVRGESGGNVKRSRTLRIKRAPAHRRISQRTTPTCRPRANRQMGRRGRLHESYGGRPNNANSRAG